VPATTLTRDRVSPAGSHGGVGSAQDAAVPGRWEPMRLSWCTEPTPPLQQAFSGQGNARRRTEASVAEPGTRLLVFTAATRTSAEREKLHRFRYFLNRQADALHRRTPWSWGWTTCEAYGNSGLIP
jgi:hypothetical protein